MRIRLGYNYYTPSTFGKFVYGEKGTTVIIDEIIKILESKDYVRVNGKRIKSRQYSVSHNGYELMFKDVRYDVIYYIRQDGEGKVSIISHCPDCYWWEEYYLHKKRLTHAGCRSYQIPVGGYIDQNKESVDIVVKKMKTLIHKNPF